LGASWRKSSAEEFAKLGANLIPPIGLMSGKLNLDVANVPCGHGNIIPQDLAGPGVVGRLDKERVVELAFELLLGGIHS